MPLDNVGRLLVVVGLVVVAAGLLFIVAGRVPFLGRLPGDIHWEHDGVQVYAPLATGLLLSVVLSVLLTLVTNVLNRHDRRRAAADRGLRLRSAGRADRPDASRAARRGPPARDPAPGRSARHAVFREIGA